MTDGKECYGKECTLKTMSSCLSFAYSTSIHHRNIGGAFKTLY